MNFICIEYLFFLCNIDDNVDIHSLDIPVNAVATALKDFFKKLPPLIDKERMTKLEDISGKSIQQILIRNLNNLCTDCLCQFSFIVYRCPYMLLNFNYI